MKLIPMHAIEITITTFQTARPSRSNKQINEREQRERVREKKQNIIDVLVSWVAGRASLVALIYGLVVERALVFSGWKTLEKKHSS